MRNQTTAAIDGDEVCRLAQDLISVESHVNAPGREAKIGRFLVTWFEEREIAAELQPVVEGRSNVVVRIPGGNGPRLMLNGHLDTVPGGDMVDPFVPRVADGVLWGRGACDMKGAIAAMCCAVVAVAEHVVSPRGELLFVGTVDEETGSLGAKALVDSGLRPCYAVVGEPTSLRVGVAHKGSCFVRVTLSGRGAHGSVPEEGVNAASYAVRVVAAVEGELRSALARRVHPLLGGATVSVGRICGGTQPNIVAERCEVLIDRRYLPGEADGVTEIEQLVGRVCAGVNGLTYSVQEMACTAIVPHVPLETKGDGALVRAVQAAFDVVGIPERAPIGVTYWTDGGHFAANGVEAVILGPGSIADAHGPSDRVHVSELVTAARLYAAIAQSLID
jgi:succinyl-diaminopimelate desuccinylase